MTFFLTASVVPKVSDMADIIKCAGGKIDSKQRSLKLVRQYAVRNPKTYIVITCATDHQLLQDFFKDIQKGKPAKLDGRPIST